MSKHQPLFITLEGGEGTGKTSLIEQLSHDLTKRGYEVITTREPGGTVLGEQIREWLLHHKPEVNVCDYAELLLFLASRAQHLYEVILPALKQGKIVLCDRFNDSSVVYQGAARGLGMDVVKKQSELACQGVTPDITLFLDVDPVIGLERTRNTVKASANEGEVDRIESEKIAFHHAVREGMQQLASTEPERIKTIDASQSLETVFQEALGYVLDKLTAQ